MQNKIGFLTVFALVISSQIGSGIFILPISIAPYGIYSLISLVISGAGAVSIALVFATLCTKFPETGGPHIYAKYAFGSTVAFFVGWTYWVISWVSTTALVVVGVGYLTPLFCENIQNMSLILELLLLVIITLVNLKEISTAGYVELLIVVVKVFVLVVIPIAALFLFDKNNFIISEEISSLTIKEILARSTLLTLWCFIGVELATSPAGSVDNPNKIIPKAVVLGTICVAIIYFINSFAIMGLINGNDLVNSRAPYVDAIKIMSSGNWNLVISIIAFIFCIGSLNAWVLSSGQVAFGLAKDKLIPQFFAKKNRYGSPFFGVITSSIGTAILLIFTSNKNFTRQITSIIDFSVISFLFVYLICSLAFLKITIKERNYYKLLIGIISTTFCCWVIRETSVDNLLVSSLFTVSGIPLYLFWYRKSS
ncbi:amino acid permease [Wolbachia endosymbiont of Cruorifilaria tuberocauda]|uniref:APC family permease n=1 Tax=Wolbachia endosymbiont of Cruorifilaria tuberocauda TaxID=1812111 RepID=UPI0015884232|nr:amino acid permease [Wolbachia endosymbiont of Cruorifilaria tuberocauda]QKX01952.1 amino acid permease [Wolbachia endosymbiont of Cruorifilaria tuberocauda]